jgi:hypothetical protein
MVSFPRVVGAAQVALEHEGIALGPLSIELWDDRVIVRFAGLPTDPISESRERQFHAAHYAWVRDAVRSGSVEDAPEGPLHPLGEVHEVVTVSLTDDKGTPYRWKSSDRGGVTWDFISEARFEPAVPDDATELLIGFSIKEGQDATVRVPLR